MRKHPPRHIPHRRSAESVKTSWDLDASGMHPAAPATRHFFSRDSLASALDVAVFRGDALLFAGAGGKTDISGVTGSIVAENSYAIELKIAFKAGRRRVPGIRLIVARNSEELSQMVRVEAKHLSVLAPRLTSALPSLQQAGTLLLPERHQKKPQSRRIAAYATGLLADSAYAGLGQRGQLLVYADSPRLLSLDATDAVKQRVLELCLRSHDARMHTAMPPPDLVRGAMRLGTRDIGRGLVVLCGVPFLWDHIDAAALLHRLTGFDWTEGSRQMPLLPADHERLHDAMVAALGKTSARAWANEYRSALQNGRYKPHHRFTLDDAAQLCEALGA